MLSPSISHFRAQDAILKTSGGTRVPTGVACLPWATNGRCRNWGDLGKTGSFHAVVPSLAPQCLTRYPSFTLDSTIIHLL
jgi:hypothetical protein